MLQGVVQPADPSEQLRLAQLCEQYKKRYVAAARLYGDAFAAKPELANDPGTGQRYHAACSAALAAAGQGADAADLPDKTCARLRRQALEWLQGDLALWARQADSPDAGVRQAVAQTLRRWQTDSDLAGLREPDAIATLPADEQQACQQLWADVETLLKRAQEK